MGLIAVNPALSIPYLREKPFKPYIYSLKEIGGLLEAACRFEDHSRRDRCFAWRTMQAMICLIYACGLRLGEALNLRIKDVDFSEATLSLWKTKFHKERLVPLSAEMANKLKEYLALRIKRYPPANPESPFFCHARGKYAGRSIETLFRKLLVVCALSKPNGPAPRIHDLRHSFAVHRLYQWYQEGEDILNKLALLSTYMGHAQLEYTQVYLTITRALLREGNRRFKDFAEGIPQGFVERIISHHGSRRP
ncbi:MAG: tyrosine-type recombinase/integrase [Elusimicrobia bacterium]|nr:tyrosine-type recombinase/integrase [Elusimicrobiota bacterium]